MTATGTISMLDAALAYARRGWRIFPVHSIRDDGRCTCGSSTCDRQAKHPRNPHGLTEATIDEAVIRSWWSRWPDANIGLATGAESGLLVIDLDGPEGLASWQRLIDEHGPVDTLEIRTGSGGRHLYFQYPAEGEFGNRTKVLPGIDVRGERDGKRGYVVAPPSMHISGNRYVVEHDRPVAPAPPWLLAILRQPQPAPACNATPNGEVRIEDSDRLRLCLDAMLRIDPDRDEKDGSKRLFGWACRCVEHGLNDDLSLRVIRAAEIVHPFPRKWSDAEIVQRLLDAEGHRDVKRGSAIEDRGLLICPPIDEIECESLSWLWHRRIPMDKLVILAGPPGIGKSFLTLDMAARISNGTPWPDARDRSIDIGSTILLSAEDAPGDTIRPRLEAASADLTRIHVVEGVRVAGQDEPRAFDLQRDLDLIAAKIDELGRRGQTVRLVVLDPLDAYLGDRIDSHRSPDVRRVLHPVSDFARRHSVAVVAVCHLNKTPSPQAMYRVLGSIAFVAAARAAWVVAPDKADRDLRLLLPLKMNLAKAAPSLSYKIEDAQCRWDDGKVEVTADEVLAEPQPGDDAPGALDQAVAFIREALKDGPQRAKEIDKDAKLNHVHARTLNRAKAALRVRSEKAYGAWWWCLPGQTVKVANDPPDGFVGNDGIHGNVGNVAKCAKVAKLAKCAKGGSAGNVGSDSAASPARTADSHAGRREGETP